VYVGRIDFLLNKQLQTVKTYQHALLQIGTKMPFRGQHHFAVLPRQDGVTSSWQDQHRFSLPERANSRNVFTCFQGFQLHLISPGRQIVRSGLVVLYHKVVHGIFHGVQ
jgi:hypothetical protein